MKKGVQYATPKALQSPYYKVTATPAIQTVMTCVSVAVTLSIEGLAKVLVNGEPKHAKMAIFASFYRMISH